MLLLVAGALIPAGLARADVAPAPPDPCPQWRTGRYPLDGATGLSRWTPVIVHGRGSSLSVTDEAGGGVEAQSTPSFTCVNVFIPKTSLEPNHTYTVQADYSETTFTTGDSLERPELTVDVGEDQDSSQRLVVDIHFSQDPLLVIKDANEQQWVSDVAGTDWQLTSSDNTVNLSVIGVEGQVVTTHVEGTWIREEEEDEKHSSCAVAPAAKSPKSTLLLILAALLAAAGRFGSRHPRR